MLFTIQSFVEDYFNKRGLQDPDGYAVRLSNCIYYNGEIDEIYLLKKVSRLRTSFFAQNRVRDRKKIEADLIGKVRSRIKGYSGEVSNFPGGITIEARHIQHSNRITLNTILLEFRNAVEARAIDIFWKSRKKNQLMPGPEKIAQGLLAVFIKGVLREKGIVIRELESGIGYVDLGVVISSTLHLVEVKILTKGFLGVEQLETYMKTEGRPRGSLLVLDAMPSDKKVAIPSKINSKYGVVTVFGVDINPNPPSSLNILKR